MLETAIALGITGALLALGVLLRVLTPEQLLLVGAALALVGLVLSVPGGIGYHLTLRRGLLEAGELPRGWYWAPTSLHGRLSAAARARVLPFFVLGATGATLIFVGCALALVYALRV